ncbi:MAG TPA: type II CAAX endopeptidase family protein [Gemmataceae bacterium]|nr:type II CAAX endopeptidase family protein [Gemmataceae bacterium]
MSTDSALPEPDETEVSDRPLGPPPEPEPYLAEVAEDDGRPIRLRRRRPARPPGPPHPGFWWAIVWCVLMLIVAQFLPAIGVVSVIIGKQIVVQVVKGGGGGPDQMKPQDLQHQILLPTLLLSQLVLIAFSIMVLRLIAGRDWYRQIGLGLPAVKHVVLAVLLWPALAFSASGVYLLAQKLPGVSHILSYFVALCGALSAVAVAWALVRSVTGRDWVKWLAAQPTAAQLLLAPLECLAVAGVGAAVFWLVDPYLPRFELFNTGDLMGDMVKEFRTWPSFAAVLIIGLGPGLGEELWCRAFLGRGLVGRHGAVMGVILTSLFFGAIHVDPHQGTMAAVMGLALHFTYLMTRSLWVPMLLHFLNNSLSVIADKLPEVGGRHVQDIDTDPNRIPWAVFAASAFLLLAVGWALYASRGRMVRSDGSDLPPWQPPYPGVALPPPDSGTAVAYPWPGVAPALAVVGAVVALGCAMYWG